MNLFFVPLVSFIIFPLTLITYILPFMSFILKISIIFMENISLFLSKFMIKIYFPHINLIELIIFYIILFIIIKFKSKKCLILLASILIFWRVKPFLETDTRIFYIDVGQGDSTLIVTPRTRKAIMIDTGGKIKWKEEEWKKTNKNSDIATSILIPLMRNLGINKLDYLILSHGGV